MKILFIADLHIKLGQKNVPVDWAWNRYVEFVEQLNEAAEAHSVDLIIFGGDTFDRVPTLDELELYFSLISDIKTDTILIDGNHEATKKGCTFLDKLVAITSAINPKVKVVTELTEYTWGTLLPYRQLKEKGLIETLPSTKPLFTHVRGEIPPHVKPEVDLAKFERFPVVFAGDLHAHSNTQLNIVYPGSPMTTSFHRDVTKTGYLIIEDSDWTWHEFDLPQLIRKTVSDPKEMVQTERNHTIYELEGDLAELADIENNELLDKKVVKRNSESQLLLNKEMSISDELTEYLLYILELPEDKTKDIVSLFNDYSRKT